jgi:hypothetical protein
MADSMPQRFHDYCTREELLTFVGEEIYKLAKNQLAEQKTRLAVILAHSTLAASKRTFCPMARLSNVSEGLIEPVGRKPKSRTTYGRHNGTKSLSRVYGIPPSPPKELRQRRSWTSINKDRSARQIEDGLTPPSSTQKLFAKSSPASSPAPTPLRKSKRGLGPRPIAKESIVQSTHVPALQPRAASNRSPVQSRSKLPPKPATSHSNTDKSAAVETANQAEFPPPDINQLSNGVGIVPLSDDRTWASTAADNLNLGPSEVDGEGNPGAAKQSRTHTAVGDNEYFEVEAIKSCKLSSRVRRFSTFFTFNLAITLLL